MAAYVGFYFFDCNLLIATVHQGRRFIAYWNRSIASAKVVPNFLGLVEILPHGRKFHLWTVFNGIPIGFLRIFHAAPQETKVASAGSSKITKFLLASLLTQSNSPGNKVLLSQVSPTLTLIIITL
jgi:hypothetical protein